MVVNWYFDNQPQAISLVGNMRRYYQLDEYGPLLWDEIADRIGSEIIIHGVTVVGFAFKSKEAYMAFLLKWDE